ncbi:MAG: glycosyltransferase family 2 protein [Burkholderiales bacterium]|jgi:hypothetical protein|nr:glycosyltransferase family 2 protein [Burkholderiales bacterium]
MNANILILAAGQSGFDNHDGGYPLCLSEYDGVSLIERIVLNTNRISGIHYAFALLDKEIESYHLDRVATLLAPNARIFPIPESTKGSACTALLAASQLNPEASLLIVSANELVDLDLSVPVNDFEKKGVYAGTLIFRSVHPRYSYVMLNDRGLVTQVAQKKPITHHATAGIFWYKRTEDFVNAAKRMIGKGAVVDGKFYVAPTFNELILEQKSVGVFEIANDKYLPLKTERQIYHFEQGGQS